MRFLIAQAVGFQVLWFAGVLGHNQWLALGLLLIAANLLFSPQRQADITLWPLALLGMAGDAVLAALGFFSFNHPPFWLGLIWMGFILSLNHSLGWLHKFKAWQQGLLGGLVGTLSYLAGHRLGAVDLPLGTLNSAIVLALYWSLLLPTLMRLTRQLTPPRVATC